MAIRLENLSLGYDRHPAVHHLSGRFATGSLTALVGPNGAGKSTLLKGIKGLLPLQGGRLECVIAERAAIAYLPQQAELDSDFPICVLDVVLMGHWRRVGLFGGIDAAMRRKAVEALAAVGLPGFEQRPIGSLSVGQRQRVLFARVMLEDGAVILLDEPFAAIDARTTTDLLALIRRWSGEGRTIIAVLHDFDQVRRHFPQTLLIARELIGWGATETVLTPENLLKARAMSEAWDEKAAVCARGAA